MPALEALQLPFEGLPAPNIDLRPGANVGRRYQIKRLLASGGMATIYEGYDIQLERPVALKVLRPQIGKMPELVELFLNEARSMGRLHSPHVARILDCGGIQHFSAMDLPYIVLELLEGVDLWTLLQQNVRLSEPLTARYMLDACEGLAEAHSLGIIHCDIKPENLFLARVSDGTQTIKLLDFGISQPRDESGLIRLNQVSDFVGSPLYMSPEQMRAMPVDIRADVWGIGAVMFECATGQPAFGGSTVAEIRANVLSKPMPDLHRLFPELSKAFLGIVERCLERNPACRFQSVAELAKFLEPLATPRSSSSADRIARRLGIQSPETTSVLSESKPTRTNSLAVNHQPISRRRARPGVGLSVFAVIACLIVYTGYRYSERLVSVATETRHYAASMIVSILR